MSTITLPAGTRHYQTSVFALTMADYVSVVAEETVHVDEHGGEHVWKDTLDEHGNKIVVFPSTPVEVLS